MEMQLFSPALFHPWLFFFFFNVIILKRPFLLKVDRPFLLSEIQRGTGQVSRLPGLSPSWPRYYGVPGGEQSEPLPLVGSASQRC